MAQFSWAAAADVGLGLLGAWGNNKLAKAKAETDNAVREANNEIASAQRGLAATVRGINNRRLMESAGRALDAQTRNAARTSDAVARGNFEESIKGAEQWGAQAARAAGSGLGGGGIEAISRTTSLQIQRRQELLESQGDAITYEQAQATTQIMSNALIGLEAGPLTARQDFTRSTSNMASDLIAGLFSKRDSLSVALGSLVPGREPVSTPIPDGNAVGSPIPPAGPPVATKADFAFTTPVPDSIIAGVPLPSRGFEQADVRRIDNVTLK
jgi:hypothetical protein